MESEEESASSSSDHMDGNLFNSRTSRMRRLRRRLLDDLYESDDGWIDLEDSDDSDDMDDDDDDDDEMEVENDDENSMFEDL